MLAVKSKLVSEDGKAKLRQRIGSIQSVSSKLFSVVVWQDPSTFVLTNHWSGSSLLSEEKLRDKAITSLGTVKLFWRMSSSSKSRLFRLFNLFGV